jgi:hypothetical protein
MTTKKSEDKIREHYNECVVPCNAAIKALLKREKDVTLACRSHPTDEALQQFALANSMLDLTSQYIALDGIMKAIHSRRDEGALNEGRKSIFKAIIALESVIQAPVDAMFNEYEENLAKIASIGINQRYRFCRKLELTIALLKNAYGANTKWRWSFVDVEGRSAAVVKSLFDIKNYYSSNVDITSPEYETTVWYLDLVQQLLENAADRFHERFELATKNVMDLFWSVRYLSALERVCALMNNRDKAEEIKRKYTSWKGGYDKEFNKLMEKEAKTKAARTSAPTQY